MTTEAGRRLLDDWVPFGKDDAEYQQAKSALAEGIAAIEAEAEHRGYLRANDCDHSECIEHEEALLAEVEEGLREPHHPWCSCLMAACDCGHDAAVLDLARGKRA